MTENPMMTDFNLGERRMITQVATISIPVTDQDRAKAFYVEKLGLELVDDVPLFPGADVRWLSVKPKDAQTAMVLYKMNGDWEHYAPTLGKSQSLTLSVTNLKGYCEELKAKGVTVSKEPSTEFWGTFANILDPDNNELMLVER
jgi:catechol 2,3-dioxygenase-like lactoylglutathione lyase family enzyme